MKGIINKNKLKVYYAVFRIRLINSLQYRAAAIAGLTTQFFWGFMLIMIFEAFYKSGGPQDFSFDQLVTYIWLQQAFLALFMIWMRDKELGNMIIEGNIAYELVRPHSVYSYWYAKLIGSSISSVILRFPLVIIIALLLPAPYNLSLPAGGIAFLLFFISLILGAFITIGITMLMYVSMFKTHSMAGSFILFGITTDLLGGHLIPIPLMPDWLQNITNFLPFRYATDLPFRIYLGDISGLSALSGIMIEIIWILALFLIGSKLMSRVTKKIVVYGG